MKLNKFDLIKVLDEFSKHGQQFGSLEKIEFKKKSRDWITIGCIVLLVSLALLAWLG